MVLLGLLLVGFVVFGEGLLQFHLQTLDHHLLVLLRHLDTVDWWMLAHCLLYEHHLVLDHLFQIDWPIRRDLRVSMHLLHEPLLLLDAFYLLFGQYVRVLHGTPLLLDPRRTAFFHVLGRMSQVLLVLLHRNLAG